MLALEYVAPLLGSQPANVAFDLLNVFDGLVVNAALYVTFCVWFVPVVPSPGLYVTTYVSESQTVALVAWRG